MNIIFDPSVPVGTKRPWLTAEDALAARVRMVLETRPGTLPWRPEFGCDLEEFVGYPATPKLLVEVRWRVRSALERWIPDADIESIEVRMAPNETSGSGGSRSVPLAESALMSVGVQASLTVDIEMKGPMGSVSLTTQIDP